MKTGLTKQHKFLLGLLIAAVTFLLVGTAMFVITSLRSRPSPVVQAATLDWSKVDQAMGRPHSLQPDDVYRYSFPRSDLSVTIGDATLKPNFAAGSHVEFKQTSSNQAVLMGDLVLTEGEVSSVISRLQQDGIAITALHNHILGETPRLMYLHIEGAGDPVKRAQSIHDTLTLTGTPLTAPSSSQNQAIDLDTKQMDQIMGRSGKANNGIYQYGIPRAEKITENNMVIPPAMGVATAINFQPIGNGKAATTGDFVLTANEVNPVAAALQQNGIEVTALHSHTLIENPRLFYMHFYGNDDAVKLAHGLRAAVDKTNSAKK